MGPNIYLCTFSGLCFTCDRYLNLCLVLIRFTVFIVFSFFKTPFEIITLSIGGMSWKFKVLNKFMSTFVIVSPDLLTSSHVAHCSGVDYWGGSHWECDKKYKPPRGSAVKARWKTPYWRGLVFSLLSLTMVFNTIFQSTIVYLSYPVSHHSIMFRSQLQN